MIKAELFKENVMFISELLGQSGELIVNSVFEYVPELGISDWIDILQSDPFDVILPSMKNSIIFSLSTASKSPLPSPGSA